MISMSSGGNYSWSKAPGPATHGWNPSPGTKLHMKPPRPQIMSVELSGKQATIRAAAK